MEKDLSRRGVLKLTAMGVAALALDTRNTLQAFADGQGSDVVQLPQPKVIDQVSPEGRAPSVTALNKPPVIDHGQCGIIENSKAVNTQTEYEVFLEWVSERVQGRFVDKLQWFTKPLHRQPNPCANKK